MAEKTKIYGRKNKIKKSCLKVKSLLSRLEIIGPEKARI